MVGPNCLGAINTRLGLDATFAEAVPPAGNVGLMTQSGGVALALVEDSRRLGLGVSSFMSVGNKADISGNDLLQYWEDDPHTRVVLLYPVLVSAEGATILDARVRRGTGRTAALAGDRSAAPASLSVTTTEPGSVSRPDALPAGPP